MNSITVEITLEEMEDLAIKKVEKLLNKKLVLKNTNYEINYAPRSFEFTFLLPEE